MTSGTYQGSELEAMEAAHNYHETIMTWFLPHLGKRVVELGAGLGSFSECLVRRSRSEEITLIEPARALYERLATRFAERQKVRCVHGTFDEIQGLSHVDSLVMVNVLEHIEDDRGVLHAWHRRLAPHGTILLLVPAMPWLYGSLDAAFGHVRRYTKPLLDRLLRDAGFTIVALRYFNFPGLLSWLVAGKVLAQTTLSARQVRLYDQWVVPCVGRVERWVQPPVGQSLLAIGRK